MHRLLQELHRDHVHLSRILGILENQLDLLRGGGQADVHVLGEIVDYVQSYPDMIHHPREDVIFRVYLERFSARSGVIEPLLEEHRVLIIRTAAVGSMIEQWRCDLPVPRDRIVMQLTDYLSLQRNHLNVEEQSVYGLLDEGLGSEDWRHIEAVMPRGTDPLFGDLTRRRYANIYDQVMAHDN